MQYQAREKMADCVDSCSAIEPLMRAIDCVPESDDDGGCRIGNENGVSVFDVIRNLKGSSNKSTRKNFDVTNTGDRIEILEERLEIFVSKKWLTQNEYQKYIAFLSTFDRSDCIGESGNYALKELEKELDATEEKKKMSKQQTSWRDMITSTIMTATPSAATTTYNTNTGPARVDVNNSNSRQPLATATHRVVNGVNAPTIVYPKDISNCLSEDAISELFVETCFFARLGFVQPPCCLSCTYKEALKSYKPVLQCPRWVIWRSDANKTLDPNHANDMRDNAIVVQCQSARKLIAGKMVEGFQWDKRKKILNSKSSELMHVQRRSSYLKKVKS